LGSDTSYEEVKEIPAREELTFTNGFYVDCSSVWVDLRDSTGLTAKYRRPALAKLYRAYISEMVAVMHLSPRCVEVNIAGDGVWGVFDTPYKAQVDSTFETVAYANSVVDLLNCRLEKRGYDPIRAGIGVHYGRILMVKAGYKGSGINDLVYMGEVVNQASFLSDQGSRNTPPIYMSGVFHQNLKEEYQEFCTPRSVGSETVYTSYAVNIRISEWIEANCG
jgi:class 3 adenylate cyclase